MWEKLGRRDRGRRRRGGMREREREIEKMRRYLID